MFQSSTTQQEQNGQSPYHQGDDVMGEIDNKQKNKLKSLLLDADAET